MTPVRLEPATIRSLVKHSTTEPLHSLVFCGNGLPGSLSLKSILTLNLFAVLSGLIESATLWTQIETDRTSAVSFASPLKRLCCNQCEPRSDCSSGSSLIGVYTVCLIAKINH